MKATVVLGLAMALLAIVLVLPRRSTSTLSAARGGPALSAARAEPSSRSSLVRSSRPRLVPNERTEQPPFESILAGIETEPDPERRGEALELAAGSVADADLRATLEALAGRDTPAAVELRNRLVRRWADNDASAAAAWVAQLSPGREQQAAAEQTAIAWAEKDPSSAAAWMQTLPAGETKQAAILVLAYEAIRTDPISALDLGRGLPPSRARDDLLVQAAGEWAGRDSAAAAAWAAGAEPDLRTRLLAAVAVAGAERDGAAAANLAAGAIPPGEEQDRASVAIVQRWAQAEPQAAASWVAQFSDTPARGAAVENLLALWTVTDPQAAANWLGGLAKGM